MVQKGFKRGIKGSKNGTKGSKKVLKGFVSRDKIDNKTKIGQNRSKLFSILFHLFFRILALNLRLVLDRWNDSSKPNGI